MFTDSHCHLNFPELLERLTPIRAAMAEAQVDRALCICTTMEEFEGVHQLATSYDNFWATVGVHPDTEGLTEPSFDDLLERAALPVGVGSSRADSSPVRVRTSTTGTLDAISLTSAGRRVSPLDNSPRKA